MGKRILFSAGIGLLACGALMADAITHNNCNLPLCADGILTSQSIFDNQGIGQAAVAAGTNNMFTVEAFKDAGVYGKLDYKTRAGVMGIGVKGPTGGNATNGKVANAEIDVYQGGRESLRISWAAPSLVSELQLSFLFPMGEHDDLLYNERAYIKFINTYTSVSAVFVLEATGKTTATFSGPGTVLNLSPAQDGVNDIGPAGAALWQISGASIAGILANQVELYAPAETGFRKNYLSDFAFTKLVIDCPEPPQEVPEPGTWAMLGAGLIGLGIRRGKR